MCRLPRAPRQGRERVCGGGDELRKATLEIPVLGEKRVEQLLRLLQMLANTFSALEQERHDLLARLRRVAEIARVVQP